MLRQEYLEFKASLGYIVRQKTKTNQLIKKPSKKYKKITEVPLGQGQGWSEDLEMGVRLCSISNAINNNVTEGRERKTRFPDQQKFLH
jgi:hypothetical protein